jgi:ATP-binding cassette, subfamily B, bacterial PglK
MTVPTVSIPSVVRDAIRLLPGTIRRRLAFAVALSVVLAVVEAAAIGGLFSVIAVLVDDRAQQPSWSGLVSASNRDQFTVRAASAVFFLLLLRSGLGFLAAKMQARLHAESDAWLSTRVFERALRYPYAAHLRRSSAELISVLGWCTADVSANVVGAAALASVDILMLVALASTLTLLQPLVALAMIVYFGLVAGVLLMGLAPAVRRAADDEQEANIFTTRAMMEGLHGVKAFQVAVATDVVSGEHARHRAQLASARQRKVFLAATSRQILETSVTLGIGLLAAGLFTLQRSGEAIATLGLVVAIAFRSLPSLSRLLSTLNGVRSASVSLRKIQDELHQPTTHEDGVSQAPLAFERQIEFCSVSFSYGAADVPALDAVTVRVLFGSSLGIVGSSGAGKTTLVDLLLGLLEPTDGTIEVDGVALDRANMLAWRRIIGYVPQDVFMLDGSIRDNVVFGGRGLAVDDDEVWSALEQAQLATFVRSLPAGLDTMIGERGARMSGGQRQRIGIARALYRRPSLLVLDEATSSLDLVTEAAIAETLESLDRSSTKVIIAHRLTTVRGCDQILFLEHGKVAGMGSFDHLVANVPDFTRLASFSGVSHVDQRRLV